MTKKYSIIILLFLLGVTIYAQTIEGTLTYHANQSITLTGFDGLATKQLAITTLDTNGHFTLVCNTAYKGMAFLQTADNSSVLLVVEANIQLKGTHLKELDSLVFIKGKENQLFVAYTKAHGIRESQLAGWKHLLPLYANNAKILTIIQKEIISLENNDQEFIKNLPKDSYIKWFIPIRKIVSEMPVSAKKHTERIPQHLYDFRHLNFNNPFINTSGILAPLLDGHYWLLENSGMPMDSMYAEMNKSTDYWLENLSVNQKLLSSVTNHVFDFFEKRSLFKASEYLALKALTQNSCTLDDDLAKQLETYRIMKAGNTAPDILFTGTKFLNGMEMPGELKLSTMHNKYTLVVFGSSWCTKCAEDLPKIKEYYQAWKAKGVEVVFISLDTEKEAFTTFVKDFPWLSVCDFKSWKTKAARNYYVFATPTLFLIDKEREILVRPSSAAQVDAWVNYKL
jgi:thiol-disulfide isomerase/thioredoxin